VTVVMPAYNSAAFIRESVESALRQSFRDLEVVVVDDGSAERVDWITELDPARVRYHWKENGGPSSARNLGAELARSDTIAFLDSDDLWEPSKLERQLGALDADPHAGFAFATFRTIDVAGRPSGEPLRLDKPSGEIAAALFMSNFVVTSSVVVRRRCFQEMKGFDPSLRWSEDYDLWLRLAERYHGLYVGGEPLGSYRVNDQGLSRNFARMFETERLVVERAVARRARSEYAVRLRQRLGGLHFELGYEYLVRRRFAEARRELAQSVRKWPWDARAWKCWVRAALPRAGVSRPAA